MTNIRPGTPQIEVPMVVAAPKPRLVKIVVNAQGAEPFSLAGFSREAKHYVAKVDIGGVAGVVAPMVGKQPPDSQMDPWRRSPSLRKIRDTVLHGRANVAH
ncbi:MAG: hypothetical protein WB919_00430 [Candidatus Sulfotelmatobacter sp.]